MSETHALNVDYAKIVGAADELKFGSPRILETHNDINEWTPSVLRVGGGSGRVTSFPTSLTRCKAVQK